MARNLQLWREKRTEDTGFVTFLQDLLSGDWRVQEDCKENCQIDYLLKEVQFEKNIYYEKDS